MGRNLTARSALAVIVVMVFLHRVPWICLRHGPPFAKVGLRHRDERQLAKPTVQLSGANPDGNTPEVLSLQE